MVYSLKKKLYLSNKQVFMGVAELLLKKKQALSDKNLKEGSGFRQQFLKEEAVIALPEGVLYKIIIEGDGVKPSVSSKVKCHYHGTTIQGEVFDSSVDRDLPAEFTIEKLIKGWQLVMPLLNVGSKAIIVIPPDLAYGQEQISKLIGPNSTLVFEVELLEIL